MITYNILRLDAGQTELRPVPDVIYEDIDSYSWALNVVADIGSTQELRPINAPDVASLQPYGVKQAWELRDSHGDKIALLGIQEVRDDN